MKPKPDASSSFATAGHRDDSTAANAINSQRPHLQILLAHADRPCPRITRSALPDTLRNIIFNYRQLTDLEPDVEPRQCGDKLILDGRAEFRPVRIAILGRCSKPKQRLQGRPKGLRLRARKNVSYSDIGRSSGDQGLTMLPGHRHPAKRASAASTVCACG